ncbi:MAG: HAD-IIIC family phosphatase, partial [Bacteroidia bacterium]
KERGIIIAVCSKNNEATAKEPFQKHPDMVLTLDDIAVFVANWDTKADNIKYIQSVLNIGFDSMVFLDDNPFERSMVRTHFPQVLVPELPEDPTLYLDYLMKLNLFETASFSEEDGQRTKQYQEEASRVIAQKSFVNEDDFLANLNMTSEVSAFTKFNVPRVAQLSQRSNQFNLRTVRYTEEDVQRLSQSDKHVTLAFTLKDKFGDNGLISVIILEKQNTALFIETWLMSCRVLKRSMENFTLNTIMKYAKENGFTKVIGEYIPTPKNSMVKDHYKELGFTETNGKWELNVTGYQDRKCFIDAETR